MTDLLLDLVFTALRFLAWLTPGLIAGVVMMAIVKRFTSDEKKNK